MLYNIKWSFFAGSLVATTSNQRIYFNTLEIQDFHDKGEHGITLDHYPDHLILVFDLTSTQKASHDFIHSERTDCSTLVQQTFQGAF